MWDVTACRLNSLFPSSGANRPRWLFVLPNAKALLMRSALTVLFFTLLLPILLLHLSITASTHSCWQSHCQSSSFSIRCTDGPPQVPAWKTADLRGTSCLINSSHKCESFPRWDWYTPPFASLASRDIRPCTSRVFWKFRQPAQTQD